MENFLQLGRLFVVAKGVELHLLIQLQLTLNFPPLDKIVRYRMESILHVIAQHFLEKVTI